MKFVFPLTIPIARHYRTQIQLAAKIHVWSGSDCVWFMQLNLKLRWVLRVAKNFMRPGSEGTIYSHFFECIFIICPITFPVTFLLQGIRA